MESEVKYENNDGTVVSTLNANSQVWLMKVPHFVYEHFVNQPKDTVLGRIKVTKDVGTDETHVTSCTLENCDESLPVEYKINEFPVNEQHFIFSEDPEEDIISLDGKVNLKLGMTVMNERDPKYRAIINQRATIANTKTKSIQSINPVKRGRAESLYRFPARYEEKTFKIERKTTVPGEKRERMDKDKLLDLIFNAYKKREEYTFKEINAIVDQPDKWLKEVLNEIADTKRDERNRQVYHLKEEFKTSVGSDNTGA